LDGGGRFSIPAMLVMGELGSCVFGVGVVLKVQEANGGEWLTGWRMLSRVNGAR
jgi:hypothetical protein